MQCSFMDCESLLRVLKVVKAPFNWQKTWASMLFRKRKDPKVFWAEMNDKKRFNLI